MIGKIAKGVFGSANDRFIKKQYKTINKINALEPQIEKLSDEELKGKTAEFKSASMTAKRLTNCCRKLLPLSAKPRNGRWDNVITMCS